MTSIPFNRPSFEGHEQRYMAQAISNGHISGDGVFSRKCHALLQEELGVPRALLITSCTHALEITAFLLNIQPGDEVIVPSFTFVSAANAFVLRGAKPVFIDIRTDTLNLDERLLEGLITSRTRAIIVMHYAGVACEMDTILSIAQRHGVAVIEDNAHGLFGRYKGRYLGTLGCLATQSFHETKNFSCGEGGALLINDPGFIERAEIIREKGTDRTRFFRGQIDKYTWIDVGSSYLPSDLLAAFLYAQLETRESIQARRRHIWDYYHRSLKEWAMEQDVRLPIVPAECDHPSHLYYILLPTLELRQRLIERLKSQAITSAFHYLPLHLSKMGQFFGGKVGDCAATEDLSDRLLRLPFYNTLSENDQDRVVNIIIDFTG